MKVIVCSREEWEKLKWLLIFSPCSSIVLIRYFCFSLLLSCSQSLLPLIFVGVSPLFSPLFAFPSCWPLSMFTESGFISSDPQCSQVECCPHPSWHRKNSTPKFEIVLKLICNPQIWFSQRTSCERISLPLALKLACGGNDLVVLLTSEMDVKQEMFG